MKLRKVTWPLRIRNERIEREEKEKKGNIQRYVTGDDTAAAHERIIKEKGPLPPDEEQGPSAGNSVEIDPRKADLLQKISNFLLHDLNVPANRIAEIAAAGPKEAAQADPEQEEARVLAELRRQTLNTDSDLFATSIIDKAREQSLIKSVQINTNKKVEGLIKAAGDQGDRQHQQTLKRMLTKAMKGVADEFKTKELKASTQGYLRDIIDKYITMVDMIAEKNGKNQENVISAEALSLAMSGGKTVMEGVLGDDFLDYAKKKGLKGIVIGKPPDLADKAMKGKDGNWSRFDRKSFNSHDNTLEEGKIIVMSYKEMQEPDLHTKKERLQVRILLKAILF